MNYGGINAEKCVCCCLPGYAQAAGCQLACVNLTEMLVMCSTLPSCLKRVGLKVDQLCFVLKKKKKSSRLHYFSVLVYFLAYILCIEKGALTRYHQLQGDCFFCSSAACFIFCHLNITKVATVLVNVSYIYSCCFVS